MIRVIDALSALDIKDVVVYGRPSNESEFNQMLKKVIGKDKDDNAILSSDPNDFGVTWSQVEAKKLELEAEYEANQYQRQRAVEYPSWKDQLDKIYHEGVDAWKAEIKVIKDKYPKS